MLTIILQLRVLQNQSAKSLMKNNRFHTEFPPRGSEVRIFSRTKTPSNTLNNNDTFCIQNPSHR